MPVFVTAANAKQQISPERGVAGDPLSRSRLQMILAALTLIVFTFIFMHPALVVHRGYGRLSPDVFYMRAIFRFHVLLTGTFLVAWLLQPVAVSFLSSRRERLTANAQRTFAAAAVTCVCVVFGAFVIVFGRWQFGGFDDNIIAEIGWRQVLGQHPYTQFPTTSPPLFNLGIALAFRVFGVSWDAMLLLTAIFTAVTLGWQYLLLRRFGLSVTAALGTACAVEIATMLCCCFWWYNNTTLLLAAIFFLASFLLSRLPDDRFARISFVLSFALLVLDKPNIAGVTIAGSLALLLFISKQRLQIALLTLAGAALAGLVLLAAHISVPAMLAAYQGAARERGAFSSFGYNEFSYGEKRLILLWYFALFLPLLGCARPFVADLRARRWSRAAGWLFFPLAFLIAIYGLRGNGELRDVETAVLVASLGLLAFSLRTESRLLPRYTAALLCGMAASNLYTGVTRDRVYTIGPHMFFEWRDRQHIVESGPLKHMRVSGTFAEVNQEIGQALRDNPGPYFFGPRVDYGYMAFGIPSPLHFPAWWHPGTAFARADMHKVVTGWEQDRFATLIYFKGTGQQTPYPETTDPAKATNIGDQSTDYTYYPASLLKDLRTLYIRDDRYPRITLYHRRPGM